MTHPNLDDVRSDNKPLKATDSKILEQEIMSACVSKNEREWWAKQEIEKLREQLQSSQGKGVDSLRTKEKIQEAIKKLNLKLTNGKTDHLSVKRLERLIYGLEICGRKPWRANAS